MEKLSIQILCFIILIAKVWCRQCYDKTYHINREMDCLDGCCEPSDPGEKITCCDPTAAIFGIVFAVVFFIIAVLKLCLWFMKRFASHTSDSHNEREVLITQPT